MEAGVDPEGVEQLGEVGVGRLAVHANPLVASDTAEPVEIVHGGVRLDLGAWRCTIDGTSVELTGVEFRLPRRLLETPGRYHSCHRLMRAIHKDHRVVGDRTIDSHVENLRRKLAGGSVEAGELIRSRYGFGYGIE